MNGKEYFHINSEWLYNQNKPMEKDQKILIGNTCNPFFDHFMKVSMTVPVTNQNNGNVDQIQVSTYFDNVANGNITNVDSQVIANFGSQAIDSLFTFSRELFLENVRLEYFPHLPSRTKCIWLCQAEIEVERWAQIFKQRKARVVKINIEGNTFCADSMLLPLKHETFEVWHDKAFKYWGGGLSNSPIIETLFVGEATVTEVWELSFVQVPVDS